MLKLENECMGKDKRDFLISTQREEHKYTSDMCERQSLRDKQKEGSLHVVTRL